MGGSQGAPSRREVHLPMESPIQKVGKYREARMGSQAASILSMLSEVAVQSTNSLYLAWERIKIW
jgi:hypothetical protein